MMIAITDAKIGRVMKKRDKRIGRAPRLSCRSEGKVRSVAGEGRLAAEWDCNGVRRRRRRLSHDPARLKLRLHARKHELSATDDDLVGRHEAGADDPQSIND